MHSERACQFINELSPRPGYTHEAVAIDDDRCSVRITQLDAPESSPDRPGYREFRGRPLPRWYDVDCGVATDEGDVTHALIGAYLAFDAHELREFLRDSRGTAHLHPHTPKGRMGWSYNGGQPDAPVERAPDFLEILRAEAVLS